MRPFVSTLFFGAAAGLVLAGAAGAPALRAPATRGGKTLRECLAARHSTRQFAPTELPAGALDQILWAADGINRDDGKRRTHPSAFECYPVALYVVERTRISRYDPAAHELVPREAPGAAEDFRAAILGPSSFAAAPAVLVLTVNLAAFPDKAPAAMRAVWAHAECGAIGQNVYLACADLGLGTVFAAAGNPEKIAAALGSAANEAPAYVMPVGMPL
ncbi:MAG TPA: nitroreductase family protein [Planctomycetota bacterium]|jgi:nitroreductase|nr:nitroreductase family protein [Planctomycetota bacterium]OQC22379.1 MAG: Nitroreductase family protein [Planctomycetes bacterium ADurb.Bin069]HNR98843.1 nitroreductase family protein [Planctomycetota bacterium]HNU26672.1 nitroreductase family protein [Planctomycetota bacterium]HOE29171.1 nitroreductase family protein [Planctomycetota bacterium]